VQAERSEISAIFVFMLDASESQQYQQPTVQYYTIKDDNNSILYSMRKGEKAANAKQ
jgi:hypothetical protein